MEPLVLLVVAVVVGAVGVGLLVWALACGPDRGRAHATANLRRGFDTATTGAGAPVAAGLGRRVVPAGSVRLIQRLLVRAGRPGGWSVDRLLSAKVLLTVVALVLGLLLISARPVGPVVVLVGLVVVVAFFLPELLLWGRASERSKAIGLALPDTLDQMTVAVEAGLGFDAAMERAGRNGKGPLAEELLRTLQDMQIGHTRREAYQNLTLRTDDPDLSRFVRAIVQGDKHGISVADVLRTQAKEMRLKRSQRAEEQAMKIPVKVIFPLMVCILPVLFIVLLGPTVINIMQAFS